MTGPVSDEALDIVAKVLINYQSNGICTENYPDACSMCDCFNGSTVRHGIEQARAVLAVVRPVIERDCADQIAAEIEAYSDESYYDGSVDVETTEYWYGLRKAAEIARSHGGKDQKQ